MAKASNKHETSFFRKTNPLDLEFSNLCYSVKLKDKSNKELLHSMTGKCKSGTVTALMGPSGAGKTTLLNVLSWRANQNISGDILMNSEPRKKAQKKTLGYVMQKDIFFPSLTVEQTLTYTTRLRRADLSKEQQKDLVNEIMGSLQLTSVKDVPVGDAFMKGISGGELKRLNVSNEFISNPAILFMDEPTTGLDSTGAVAILDVANSLANDYKINVILSIHQPSSQAFSMLNRVILISDGYIVYQGPANELLSYLAFVGYPTPKGWNVSDYVMDLLYEGDAKNILQVKYPNYIATNSDGTYYMNHREYDLKSVSLMPLTNKPFELAESPTYSPNTSTEESYPSPNFSEEATKSPNQGDTYTYNVNSFDSFHHKYPSYISTLWTLLIRGLKKDIIPSSLYVGFSQNICISFLVGILWFQNLTEYSMARFNDRIGCLFFGTTYFMFSLGFLTLEAFPRDRFVIAKERASKSFPISAYLISRSFTDVFNLYIYPLVWILIAFPLIGIEATVENLIGIPFVYYLIASVSHSLGMAVASSVDGMLKGAVILAVYMLFSMISAGLYIPYENMPFFLKWARWISITNYGISLVTYFNFENITFTCDDYPGCTIDGHILRQPFATGFHWIIDSLFLCGLWVFGKVIAYFSLRFGKLLKMG